MNKKTKLNLELASYPLRNRRLFYACVLLLVVIAGGVSYLSANLYFEYKKRVDETYARIEEVERNRGRVQLEEKRASDLIEAESALSQSKIDFINSLIYRKSFSWIGFLSDLEGALPPRCYIVSLAPSPRGDRGVEVRIRVASPTLDDLLRLYTQLVESGFKEVQIRSEEQTDNGLLMSEVSFIYERLI
jgi:hypothetical protein